MTVKAILDEKGRELFTLSPDDTIEKAAATLAKHKIGALVVTTENGKIAGILSERDIVRVLADQGASVLKHSVSEVMTKKVKVCKPQHTVHDVMEIMTSGRFRHLPVEVDGVLAGIISIGDVVKRRIEEVEREAEEIRSYISTA